MPSPYLAAALNRSDTSAWFVLRSKDGGIVAKDLTQARAITLANTLNYTVNALRMAWWEARNQKPPRGG